MRNLKKNIVPISDFQRQAGQIVDSLSESEDPIIITQHGRAAAVLMSTERYEAIEDSLSYFEEIEITRLIKEGEDAIARGETISLDEVKKRLGYSDKNGISR